VKEAFYLYWASRYANDSKWVQVFKRNMGDNPTREDKLVCYSIKKKKKHPLF
jgi:hypothetical protein